MSELMKTTLALQNHYLRQRVQAAVIQVAHEQRDSDNSTGLFARMILTNVKREYEDFILGVATNPQVIDNLVLADDHNTVTSTPVTDTDIIYIVNSTFPAVAEKYAPQPDNDPEDDDKNGGEEEDEGGDD